MKTHPVHLSHARAAARLREAHREEYDRYLAEERVTLGLDAKTVGPAQCGTPSGYNRHYRKGETACRPCKDALAAYSRKRNQEKREREAAEDAALESGL